MGTQKNCLDEMVLLSTQNMHFKCQLDKKIITSLSQKSLLIRTYIFVNKMIKSSPVSGACWKPLQTVWTQIEPNKPLQTVWTQIRPENLCKQFGPRSGPTNLCKQFGPRSGLTNLCNQFGPRSGLTNLCKQFRPRSGPTKSRA